MSYLAGQQILVTGGCGSIGSALVRRLLEHDPRSIRVLDTNEAGLFDLQTELSDHADTLRFLLGDVRDRSRLEMAMEDIDVVFHAAALKHVSLNEYNPFEAVQTNVQGTQNVIRMALEEEVDSFVAISTDKASNPTSVMGATKLLSERLTIAANTYKGSRRTQFACVRFGNVLGSSGSVVPLFHEQIRAGKPLTVTDPEMTRFIMSIDRAVDLVLSAHERMSGGEVFVLKMPAFKLETLVDAMLTRYAPEYGYDAAEVEVEIIGRRPGERTHEKLISRDEVVHAEELSDMFVLTPQIDIAGYEAPAYEGQNSLDEEYTSASAEFLDEDELVELIDRTYLEGARSADP